MNMLSLPVEYQDSDDDIVSVDSMDESDMYHPPPPKPLPMATLDTFSGEASASSTTTAVLSSMKTSKARTTTSTTVAAKSNRKKKYNTSRKVYANATAAAFSTTATTKATKNNNTTTSTSSTTTTTATDNALHTTRSSGKKLDPRVITEDESIIARNNDIRENRVLRNQFYSYKGLDVYREPTKGAFDFGDRDFYVFANPNVIPVNKQKWYTKDCIRGIDYTVDTAQAIVWYEEYLLAQQQVNSTQQKSKRKKTSGANIEYTPRMDDDIDASGGKGKGKVVSGGAIQERDIHILLSPMAGAVISPSSHSNGSRKVSSSSSSSSHELITTTSKSKRTSAIHNITTTNRDEDAAPHITTITTPGTKREFLLTLPDTTSISAPCDISPAELQMFIQLVKAVRQQQR